MGNVNRGKEFENVIREAFKRVPETMVVRLPDPVQGYLGYRNICDYIVYHYPYIYCFECKSVHGNLFPFNNITHNQWRGMCEVSPIKGVIAGVICWWVDFDITRYIPMYELDRLAKDGKKSLRYDFTDYEYIDIPGRKKRVFFEYDAEAIFRQVENLSAIRNKISDVVQ